MDATGDAVLAGLREDYVSLPEVHARACSAAGTLSPIQHLTRRAGDAQGTSAQLDLDDAGNAVIIWRRWVYGGPPDYTDDYAGIAAQVRSTAGTLGPLQTVSATGYSAQVALNGVGDAVATWLDSEGSNSVVTAAARP